ncbi:MAG TPA: uracil-DNA glycosylase [Alphaproteobacteria bacterium]|nr:uracil-DNA glycosylase [Alphaproteobacteria bacterium]
MAGDSLYSALKWQVEAGADEAVGETPIDRFTEESQPAPAKTRASAPKLADGPQPPAPTPAATAPQSPTAPSAEPAARDAHAVAARAQSLEDIRQALLEFEGCPLKQTATNLVYFDGNPEARIIFIGEAPGAEEDRQGLPFVGPAGRLLDRMLAAIGLDRSSVLITNTLFWRPPGNRNPTPAETAACLPFVERTIEIVDPKALIMVGGTAAKTLLARSEGIMRLRGRWFDYSTPAMDHTVPAMAIFHPAFLLRSPGQKRATWRDLIEIKKHIN